MTVLLTGATGYVGSNIAKQLINEGYDVHAIIRSESNLHLLNAVKYGVHLHLFSGQTYEMIDIFNKVKPTFVIHLASLFISEHNSEDVEKIIKSNVMLGTQLLEAAAICGTRYFINTGTFWQNYFSTEYNPVNLYAATKQAFESIAKYYLETSPIRMITLKLTDTYGPYDPRPKLMNLFKKIALSGDRLDMSPGEQELGLLYIDDTVSGYILALKYIQDIKPGEHTTYLLSPEKFYTLREAARIFEGVSGKKLNISWGGRPYRQREIMKITADDPRILEGVETIDLEEGIRRMLHMEGQLE